MKRTYTNDADERIYEYPYAEAISDIRDWREHNDSQETQAYFLHKEDLLFLIEELLNMDEKALGVRCYLSRRKTTGQNHLLVVGVVDDPNYENGRDVYDSVLGQTSRIFDLTRPCPNMCDDTSALFLAGIAKQNLPLSSLSAGSNKE
jgi:hypothetical protein